MSIEQKDAVSPNSPLREDACCQPAEGPLSAHREGGGGALIPLHEPLGSALFGGLFWSQKPTNSPLSVNTLSWCLCLVAGDVSVGASL